MGRYLCREGTAGQAREDVAASVRHCDYIVYLAAFGIYPLIFVGVKCFWNYVELYDGHDE